MEIGLIDLIVFFAGAVWGMFSLYCYKFPKKVGEPEKEYIYVNWTPPKQKKADLYVIDGNTVKRFDR